MLFFLWDSEAGQREQEDDDWDGGGRYSGTTTPKGNTVHPCVIMAQSPRLNSIKLVQQDLNVPGYKEISIYCSYFE